MNSIAFGISSLTFYFVVIIVLFSLFFAHKIDKNSFLALFAIISSLIFLCLIPFFMRSMNTDWGYIGSVLGGFLTLAGVYYTVQAENKRWKIENEKRDKEILDNKKILYKPIIVVKNIVNSGSSYNEDKI